MGSIISIQIRDKEEVKPVVAPPKKLEISYNPANKFLSMDLKNDTLWKVVDELTRVSEFSFVGQALVKAPALLCYLDPVTCPLALLLRAQERGLITNLRSWRGVLHLSF